MTINNDTLNTYMYTQIKVKLIAPINSFNKWINRLVYIKNRINPNL